MKTPIYTKLRHLKNEKRIPFHMPGHKRKPVGAFTEGDLTINDCDITEITGYDNLHHPEGMIRESMDQLRDLYHSRESWYLVNGSTVGLLASIASVCDVGDSILIARNCHKAVYNAIKLLHLKAFYWYPKYSSQYDILLDYPTEGLKELLAEHPEIRAMVITSPTYEGVVSRVSKIKQILNEYQLPLIVDEAHGAHFIHNDYFPVSAVRSGADLIIQSAHKTLPSFTQTGLLHLCGDLVSKERVHDNLATFETSSPSYLLMASAEYGVAYMSQEGDKVQEYVDKLEDFRKECGQLQHIHLISGEELNAYDYDRAKLVFSVKNLKDSDESVYDGQKLFTEMLNRYHVEFEMANASYCIAMTSVCDQWEDYQALLDGLFSIDQRLKKEDKESRLDVGRAEKVMESWQAGKLPGEEIPIQQAAYCIARDFVYLYPPDIPILVPGERISPEIVENVELYLYNGYNVIGVTQDKIRVIKGERS